VVRSEFYVKRLVLPQLEFTGNRGGGDTPPIDYGINPHRDTLTVNWKLTKGGVTRDRREKRNT